MPRFAIIRINLDTKEVRVLGQSAADEPLEGTTNATATVNVTRYDKLPEPERLEELGKVLWEQTNSGCVYWVNGTPVRVC